MSEKCNKLIDPQDSKERNNRSTVACILCGEQISADAKVCKICNNYQNWTRYLFKWGAIAGAIAALIPLISAAFSLHKIASIPQRSDLHLLPISCKESAILIAVSNKGNQAGIVLKGSLNIIRNGQVEGKNIVLHPVDEGQTLIKALESKIIKFEPKIRSVLAPLPIKGSSSQCEYEILTDINSFDDEISKVSIKYLCLE